MAILVINAGSTSIKTSVFVPSDKPDGNGGLDLAWYGQISWKNHDSGRLSVMLPGGNMQSQEIDGVTFHSGLEALLKAACSTGDGRERKIDVVGHRVVHGGDKYASSVRITDEVLAGITSLVELAPAHEKWNVEGIKTAGALLAGVPAVAVFDTAFHQTMPERARVYPGPYEWYQELGIRRFGFHGINHSYCAGRAAQIMDKPLSQLRMITCHLGGGASLAAIDSGACLSTTMGYTPLDGLMMGTRSGSIDPGIVLHLLIHEKYSPEELLDVLNQGSGLKGISGMSGDMREIQMAVADGNARAQLAYDMYVDSLRSHIGSLVGLLGGLDALVFSGGIGENSPGVRAAACEPFAFMGVKIDPEKNSNGQSDRDISSLDATVSTLVIKAQEERAIAEECMKVLRLRNYSSPS